MSQRRSILFALIIGLMAGVLCWWYQVAFARGAGDLTWPLCAARALLTANDPYTCQHLRMDGTPGPTNPLTTAFALLPFILLPDTLAAGVYFGLMSALLAYGLLRTGEFWRLFVFASFPYWSALQSVQWAPLLLAIAFLPLLYPLTLVKPHIGLPIALMRFTLRRAAVASLVILISLVISPDWPLRWLEQTGSYDGFIPMLLLPFGPLLLLALFRWQDDSARWLLLYAVMPQRMWYDQLLLWLIPHTRREMLLLVVLSWLAYFGWFFQTQWEVWWVFMLIYLPALGLVLRPPIIRLLRRRTARARVSHHEN